MNALNRSHHTMAVIAGNYRRRLAGDELAGRPPMPCILLPMPNPALSLMAGTPDAEKITGDRPPRIAHAHDHSGIWLRNAATGSHRSAGTAR